jgi:hypothetical protein
MKYSELASINVNEHVEKKNNLSYLSWSWAVDTLLRHDENASWSYGEPTYFKDGTMMIYCTVSAFGRSRTAQLPVMDFRNKSISEPDAVQVNVTMQRVLAKAIALHGLGLYIYAGEDLPIEIKEEEVKPVNKPVDKAVDKAVDKPVVKLEPILLDPEPVAREIVVPESKGEAEAVDWIVSFVDEFILGIDSVTLLRDFWKINKSTLSRVERFSKPMYKAMEDNFKTHAKKISENK